MAYEWARKPGIARERGLELAALAADNALAGRLKLEGEIWFAALANNGYARRMTRAQLAAILD